ncbi:MAG: hypothetical protein EOP84_28480 [Verrucomicrobiaceae bacterium]|nr:MAG: hypothetical protein EOP84_28480 [Verrucomicrobiaceae bacterium]
MVALVSVGLLLPTSGKAETIRMHVTNVAEKALTAAAGKLKEQGLDVKMSTEGGSTAGIAALAGGAVDIAITIRGITAQERSVAPDRRFQEEALAFQALVLVVPDDVWASGVRVLTKDQMTKVYEGRVKNWKDLGGEDRALKFYNPTQGIGVWEPFVTWLYGDMRKASLGANFEAVRSPEETRDSVEFNRGSLSVAPPRFADGKGVFALAIKTEEGAVVQPTLEEMRSHRYPLSRPIMAIVGNKPTGDVRKVLEFLRGKEGQELFAQSGLVPASPQESN